MYEKMKKAHEWLNFNNNSAKVGLILFVILSIISTIFYLKVGLWSKAFHYPSEEIHTLTEEGYRIIEENDFNSKYELTTSITNHPNQTQSLHLTVDGPNAAVEFEVINWESDKQEIVSVTHRPPDKVFYFIVIFLMMLMPAFLGSFLIILICIVIFEIIRGISYLHYKFKKS